MTVYDDYYKLLNVSQHAEFENELKRIVFNKKEREKFYRGMIEIEPRMAIDSFKPYFELYSAERKSNMQDYTPDQVAKLLASITRSDSKDFEKSKYAGVDTTAGTGSLIIQKWNDDRIQEHPCNYTPHKYIYLAEEMADNSIPYLIHNLAMRGMNAVVFHGNSLTREAKNIYFIQNTSDDFMKFSDINVMPRTKECEREFNVSKWVGEPVEHVESKEVIFLDPKPLQRERLKIVDRRADEYNPPVGQLNLFEIAEVERAKVKKHYPAGTIVIQISATQGQIGMLTSGGEVEEKYACITSKELPSEFLFYMLQNTAKRHFKRVQQGLNLTIDDIKTIPVKVW
ncbi:N-6 DNA methylase [Vagococcus lutrae]|uniref:N-6 DNA methylase n=1 Tax=Vagococcus lutrae TaxID=81947 RepID=UPI00288F78D6|nr:N-6 DNA methylase [Vagococcus lutrae]MDT2808362.1 SAM-dependent DNA methyltransferase [Vagococcus lutrae]